MSRSTRRLVAFGSSTVAFAVLTGLLAIGSPYYALVTGLVGVYITMAVALQLIVGTGRVLSFASNGFAAIGAYATALLSVRAGLNPLLAIALGVSLAVVCGVILGFGGFGVRTHYFAMLTAAFSLSVHGFIEQADNVTGGYSGIAGIPPLLSSFVDVRGTATIAVAVAIVAALTVFRLQPTPAGLALAALGDDEDAARSVGIKGRIVRTVFFGSSGGLTALAGGLHAQLLGFVSPESYSIQLTFILLAMVFVGGANSAIGAVVGAALLTVFDESIRSLGTLSDLIYALALVAVLVRYQHGLVGKRTTLRASVAASEFALERNHVLSSGKSP